MSTQQAAANAEKYLTKSSTCDESSSEVKRIRTESVSSLAIQHVGNDQDDDSSSCNELFQKVYQTPVLTPDSMKSRQDNLNSLFFKFQSTAMPIIQVLFRESILSTDSPQRTYRPISTDAISLKFHINGIFYKFALDEHKSYQQLNWAQKAIANEMKGINAVMANTGAAQHLHPPLALMVRKGHQLILAVADMSIHGDSSLVYGCCNPAAGQERRIQNGAETPIVTALVADLAESLHLRPHTLSDGSGAQLSLYTAIDVQVHRYRNGSFCIHDLARLLPATPPRNKNPAECLAFQFRAEFMRDQERASLGQLVSADVFSLFETDGKEESERIAHLTYKTLLEEAVPRAGKALLTHPMLTRVFPISLKVGTTEVQLELSDLGGKKSASREEKLNRHHAVCLARHDLIEVIHHHGVNLRLLPQLYVWLHERNQMMLAGSELMNNSLDASENLSPEASPLKSAVPGNKSVATTGPAAAASKLDGEYAGKWIQHPHDGTFKLSIRSAAAKDTTGKFIFSGDGNDQLGPFTVHGAYEETAESMSFTKQYIGKHSVQYTGQGTPVHFHGLWTIDAANKGTWSMKKSSSASDGQSQEMLSVALLNIRTGVLMELAGRCWKAELRSRLASAQASSSTLSDEKTVSDIIEGIFHDIFDEKSQESSMSTLRDRLKDKIHDSDEPAGAAVVESIINDWRLLVRSSSTSGWLNERLRLWITEAICVESNLSKSSIVRNSLDQRPISLLNFEDQSRQPWRCQTRSISVKLPGFAPLHQQERSLLASLFIRDTALGSTAPTLLPLLWAIVELYQKPQTDAPTAIQQQGQQFSKHIMALMPASFSASDPYQKALQIVDRIVRCSNAATVTEIAQRANLANSDDVTVLRIARLHRYFHHPKRSIELLQTLQQHMERMSEHANLTYTDRVVEVLCELGFAFQFANDHSSAHDTFERAVATEQNKRGSTHSHVADMLINSAIALYCMGNHEVAARERYNRAVQIYAKHFKVDNSTVIAAIVHGFLKAPEKERSQAVQSLARLGEYAAILVDSPEMPNKLRFFAISLEARGVYRDALDVYIGAQKMYHKNFGPLFNPMETVLACHIASVSFKMGMTTQCTSVIDIIKKTATTVMTDIKLMRLPSNEDDGDYHQQQKQCVCCAIL